MLIIGKKKDYSTKFPTNSRLQFNAQQDVWDDTDLIKLINAIDDIDKLESIRKCLDDNLFEYKFPDHLTFEDIKGCIAYLKEGISDLLNDTLETSRGVLVKRDDHFITRKNAVNKVRYEFFKENIQGHLPYGHLIQEFLRDPINATSLDDYTKVTQAIQSFYLENKTEFDGFEDVFVAIFGRLKPDYANAVKIDKVRVMLHNMYFNCDIGDNPNAEACPVPQNLNT